MYPSVRNLRPEAESKARGDMSVGQRGVRAVSANVFVLGVTSMITDISSEMVVSIVPLFLTAQLGFSATRFGLFEGSYQASTALVRLWGGSVADRTGRHKDVATAGYALSAGTRLGLIASTVSPLSPIPFLLTDRVGKGLRAAPRDALISLSTKPHMMATAFGVHRAMDTAGALGGPVVAFFILEAAPGAFDAVFVMSFLLATVGVLVISTLARQPATTRPAVRSRYNGAIREALRVDGMARLVSVAGLLAVLTVSDAFVYLVIQRSTSMSARYFPLLFAGTAVAYLILAVPMGRVADRIGRRKVFVAGHVPLIVLYALLASATLGTSIVFAALVLLGVYYAATDGVLPAITAGLVPEHLRGSGIAAVTVAVALGRLFSSVAFGLTWQHLGRTTAMTIYAISLAAALVVGVRALSAVPPKEVTP